MSELEKIYSEAYQRQYDDIFMSFETFYETARDKKYAVEFALGTVYFVYSFRKASKLEERITLIYEHHYKLGSSITDAILAIPEVIEEYEKGKEHFPVVKNQKKTIKYKKILGIPYGIASASFEGELEISSPFEDLSDIKIIAAELGRQRAIIDLYELLMEKYIEHGGMKDDPEILSSPISQKLELLKSSLSNSDLDSFFKALQSVFSSIPYDMKVTEGYFQSHMHLLLHMLDFRIMSEMETNVGRIDSVVETEDFVYIIEFKKDDASVAIAQIKQKKYYQPFLITPKKIVLIGVAIDIGEKNITNWDIIPFKS